MNTDLEQKIIETHQPRKTQTRTVCIGCMRSDDFGIAPDWPCLPFELASRIVRMAEDLEDYYASLDAEAEARDGYENAMEMAGF